MISRKNRAKAFGIRLIVILVTLACPVFSVIHDKFRCHPMAPLLDSNDFDELFWATLSGEYVSDNFCSMPSPEKLNETKIELSTPEFEMTLILELPHSVFHSDAQLVVTDENGEHEHDVHFSPHCFLIGRPEWKIGMASVSYCHGWRGIITTDGIDYQFEPPHPNCNNGLTLIGKRNSSFLMEQVKKQENAKKQNYSEFTMEVGIVYDQQMYEFLEEEIQALTLEQKLNFILIQWNSVQYEFNKKIQLKSRIRIVIKYIHLFKKNPLWYRIGDEMTHGMNDVCNWAKRIGLNLDHIHIGTGWKTGNLLGISGSGGICNTGRCAVSKTRNWGFQNSICHEIAHGIDIPHDYDPNCDDSPGQSGLMGGRKTGWSKCSVKYFQLWLDRGLGKCLKKEDVKMPQKPKRSWTLNIDTYGSGLLPAMYRSRDQYCEEKFGTGFSYISLYQEKTCGIQSCAILEPGPHFGAIRVDNEGINGLYCGQGKVCRLDLHCENLTQANIWEPLPIQIGGWSSWSPYSECSRSCGLGYRYSRRKCNNPSPINSEWCSGYDVRIKVCNEQPCVKESSDLLTYLRERASETCTMLVNNNFIDGNKFLKTGSPYSNISRNLRYFHHHPYRSIKGFDNLGRLYYVSPEDCATSCFKNPDCRSFEYKRSKRICDLSRETTTIHSLRNNEYWEFYELVDEEINFFQRIHFQVIVGNDDLDLLKNVSLLACASSCLREHFCNSFEYNPYNRTCQKSTATSQRYKTEKTYRWNLYEITDDVIGKEGVCEVRCDPINPMDEGILGHVGLMPDGTSCGSTINSDWRCLSGKCQQLQTRTYTEFP